MVLLYKKLRSYKNASPFIYCNLNKLKSKVSVRRRVLILHGVEAVLQFCKMSWCYVKIVNPKAFSIQISDGKIHF